MLFRVCFLGVLYFSHSTVAKSPGSYEVVKKDVLIVGGGASGAHAAVRLRDHYGLNIALVEKQDILVRIISQMTPILLV
jgi:heterodisulfide reductase subunit A-like polyferredoxin